MKIQPVDASPPSRGSAGSTNLFRADSSFRIRRPSSVIAPIPSRRQSSTVPELGRVVTSNGQRIARQSARQLGAALRQSVVAVLKVLRNVAAGAVLGLLFAFVFASGQVFIPLSAQTPVDFIAANNAWFVVLYGILLVTHLSTTLMRETFTADTTLSEPQKFLRCFRKLVWRIGGHVVIAAAAVMLFVYFVSVLAPAYKLGMYFSGLSATYITTCADVHARHIIKTETERGRRRRQEILDQHTQAQQHQNQQPSNRETFAYQPLPSPTRRRCICRRRRQSTSNHDRPRKQHISLKFALRTALNDAPMLLACMLAIAYVHTITAFLDISQQWHFIVFTVCSIVLKLGVQEAIKAAMSRRKRLPPKRLVLVLIATPTILIETQVRVYLLRLTSNTVKVVSIGVLSMLEIAIRIIKLVATQHQRPKLSVNANASEHPGDTGSKLDSKRKLLMMHTAETYADMYAEYVALGCSYAMFVCFSEHPFFAFNAGSAETSYEVSAFWLILLLQVGIKFAVDSLACTCETLLGIRFEDFDQDDWFIMTHMITMAFNNIGICAGLYAKM